MAVAWFQVETSFKTSPKVRDMADILGISPVLCRGHLIDFWSYVFDHHKDGVIEGRNIEIKIAEGASWEGDPTPFINALIECRFLHNSKDVSPDLCEECFPPKEDGTPYNAKEGVYFVHGWKERVEYYFRYLARKSLKKVQDAERQARHRAAIKAAKLNLPLVREPGNRYTVKRRGLRAAPTIVNEMFRNAINRVTSRESHAPDLRDVTQMSRVTSRDSDLSTPPSTPNFGVVLPPSTPFKMGSENTNIAENESNSLMRDVTQMSRSEKRDVTQESPCTYIHTDIPVVKGKDYSPLSLSLKDRESLKGGLNDSPPISFDPKNGENNISHQAVMGTWQELYRVKRGKEFPGDLGRLAGCIGRWRKKKYSNEEIVKRMKFFFQSTFDNPIAQSYPLMEFQKKFEWLEKGPITESGALNGRSYGNENIEHGGEDFRKFNPNRHGDDFGPDN